jgi:hypothetical protein
MPNISDLIKSQTEINKLHDRFKADLKEFRDKYGDKTFKFNKPQTFNKTRFKALING